MMFAASGANAANTRPAKRKPPPAKGVPEPEEEYDRYSAEFSGFLVEPLGSSYWSDDSNVADCCRPKSNAALELGMNFNRHFGVLFEQYAEDGSGLADPSVGVSLEFGEFSKMSVSAVALASVPLTADSHDTNRLTTLFFSLKPMWNSHNWITQIEFTTEYNLYSKPVQTDDGASDDSDEENDPTTDSSTPDLIDSRPTISMSAAVTLEFKWTSRLSFYSRVKGSQNNYEPSDSVYATEVALPGVKFQMSHIAWLAEARWLNAGASFSAPSTLAGVLGVVASLH